MPGNALFIVIYIIAVIMCISATLSENHCYSCFRSQLLSNNIDKSGRKASFFDAEKTNFSKAAKMSKHH